MNALQGYLLFSSTDRNGGIRIEYAKNKMGDISGSSSSSTTGGGGSGGGSSSSASVSTINSHHHLSF